MKYPWLKNIEHDDFAPPWDELRDAVGVEAALAVMALFEGQDPHFPKLNLYFKNRYIEAIRKEFHADRNAARIAMRYGLTEKHVRALVNAPAGQADLFCE